MHTYLKTGSDYSIGMWLPDRDGLTHFVSLFDVADQRTAMRAVNILNGGNGAVVACDIEITKEH